MKSVSITAGISGIKNFRTSFKAADNKNAAKPDDPQSDKTLAYTGAAAIGAIVLGGMMLKGKGGEKEAEAASQAVSSAVNKAAETAGSAASNTAKAVMKFFTAEGAEVQNVKLAKGLALNADGSVFTGIMKTNNHKGEEVLLEFGQDGYITSSKIGGKLRAEFAPLKNGAERSRGFAAKIYSGESGGKTGAVSEKITEYVQEFHDNGRLKRRAVILNDSQKPVNSVYTMSDFDEKGGLVRNVNIKKENSSIIMDVTAGNNGSIHLSVPQKGGLGQKGHADIAQHIEVKAEAGNGASIEQKIYSDGLKGSRQKGLSDVIQEARKAIASAEQSETAPNSLITPLLKVYDILK